MTNERAIELLNRISDSQFDGKYGDERREALEMAVRALESNLVKESGDLVQDLVKDCISRQQAIDAVKDLPNCRNGFSDTYDKACIIGVIDEQQPVDAVPVVRCKDCKHRDPEDKRCDCGHDIMWQLPRTDNWFCADAERRSDV